MLIKVIKITKRYFFFIDLYLSINTWYIFLKVDYWYIFLSWMEQLTLVNPLGVGDLKFYKSQLGLSTF